MSGLRVTDGAEVRVGHGGESDFVVVGSGPAGATVARHLARAGAAVTVVEEGPWVQPAAMRPDAFGSMADVYRDMGASVMTGRPPMPFIQGRVVGGTSVVNGAISWRLPRDVYDGWVEGDPALADALPWDDIASATDQVERDLEIHPTEPAISGANNDLLAKGAEAMGIEHRPISRNVRGCRGIGACLQGCPEGNKLSMDQTYLPDACDAGAEIWSATEVVAVEVENGRARGVRARAGGGGVVHLRANEGVVLAASAVQTPVLLLQSGIRGGPVGEHFMCHPGVSMAGRFAEPVRLWTGATQGHEVIGLRREGIKLEALGYDLAIAASRLKGFGSDLIRDIADMAHWAGWGAALRATGTGRVRPGGRRAKVRFSLSQDDCVRLRRAVGILGEIMLAAGAEYVAPGVHGWHARVHDRATMARFVDEAPLDPKAYTMVATHMFGTCRMGSSPTHAVVGLDFQHHQVPGLFVADSSVFPSNTGVNPQTAIIALATLCARHIVQARG